MNDCPIQTLNYNEPCGQSFMFLCKPKPPVHTSKYYRLAVAAAGFADIIIIKKEKNYVFAVLLQFIGCDDFLPSIFLKIIIYICSVINP